MKFTMLMIPAGYRGNTKPTDPNFPDPKGLEKMGRFNDELGKALKITDLNGLQPLAAGARVSFAKGKATVTDGPFIETREVLGLLDTRSSLEGRGRQMGGKVSRRGRRYYRSSGSFRP